MAHVGFESWTFSSQESTLSAEQTATRWTDYTVHYLL